MPKIKIIARKTEDTRLEAGDIVTVREGTHNWTPTEQAQIGKKWVEIIVNENPPNPIGYYKQPLADLELRAVDNIEKDVSDGKAIVRQDVVLATFPWDGENTPNYEMVKMGLKAKHTTDLVKTKRRRFKIDVTGITDRVTFETWKEFEAALIDKRT